MRGNTILSNEAIILTRFCPEDTQFRILLLLILILVASSNSEDSCVVRPPSNVFVKLQEKIFINIDYLLKSIFQFRKSYVQNIVPKLYISLIYEKIILLKKWKY